MRYLAAFTLMAALAIPAWGEDKASPTPLLTVAQLEAFLSSAHTLPDRDLAGKIADMKLTERVSEPTFTRLTQQTPGPHAQLALLALADESAFLNLPTNEIPSVPPLDSESQTALVHKALAYMQKALPQLPDFFADRSEVRFAGSPLAVPYWRHENMYPGLSNYHRLAGVYSDTATVRYSEGTEILLGRGDHQAVCGAKYGFEAIGVFQSAFAAAFDDIQQGEIAWSHWENSPAGRIAVFRYRAHLTNPAHSFTCLPGEIPPQPAEYDGELGVRPSDGAVLRLTNIERIQVPTYNPQLPLEKTLVEYGPVMLGGRQYLCPLRSVTVALGSGDDGGRAEIDPRDMDNVISKGSIVEGINDLAYTGYHLFRAEAHIKTEADFNPQNPGQNKRPH